MQLIAYCEAITARKSIDRLLGVYVEKTEESMSIETNPSWFSDFVEELGLPPSAAFQGYVLYNDEHDGFLAINQHADYPRTHYVNPSAWAHRYPYIQLASDAVQSLEEPFEIQALFLIGKRFMAFPV